MIIEDTRGKQRSINMCQSAWDFAEELKREKPTIPERGLGRYIEDVLLKEKARRERAEKQHKPAEPAA